eukprot:6752668-Lingulodinium_polyedra.AAC.1
MLVTGAPCSKIGSVASTILPAANAHSATQVARRLTTDKAVAVVLRVGWRGLQARTWRGKLDRSEPWGRRDSFARPAK